MLKMNRLTKVMLAIALLPLLVLSVQLFGQSASSIGGTVMDPSQAVLPNAAVTVINKATGVTSTAVTNNAGIYNFPSLQPGTYTVTVEAKDFQKASRTDVLLGMGSQVRLNFEMILAVGNIDIEVSTSAENLILDFGSSTGTVLPADIVTKLPLVSNDVMDFINVMGGVVKAEDPIFGNNNQTLAGVKASNVNIQRDGITVNEVRYNSGIVSPIRINQEMVGEFRMVLSPVDAELGRGAGQVQILTKSGSKEFHGSGVWNVQNTALDANEWYMKRNSQRPNWRNLNNYTLSASGPIIKGKTFFFATWDQQIVRSKSLAIPRALTPCARKGIYRYLDGIVNGNTGTKPAAAFFPEYSWGSPATRPSVWGPGLDSSVTGYDPNTFGFRAGDPLLTYNGTVPAGFTNQTAQLRYESVMGPLTSAARAQIDQDPYNCSAYTFDPLAATPVTGVSGAWDTLRNAYDQSGYVSRFTSLMPAANDYSIGDGLNSAGHAWTRVLHGSDTVFGSGEDNQRKSITVKIDHNINNSHRASGTYTYESDWGDDAYATWPNGLGGAVDRQPQSFTASLTSTLRSTLLNEFRMGMSRTRTHTNEPMDNPKTGSQMKAMLSSLTEGMNLPNYQDRPLIIGLGSGAMEFATDTFSWFGGGISSHPYGSRGNLPATSGGIDPRWSLSNTVTWTRGAHSFKGGFEMRFAKSWQESNGAFGFVGSANTFPSIKGGTLSTSPIVAGTLGTRRPDNWVGMAGLDDPFSGTINGNYPNAYGLLNYLVGSVGSIRQYFYVNSAKSVAWNDASKGELKQIVDLRNREFSFFFKDEWKVNSGLSLNLGFRWEYYGVPWTDTGMTAAIKGGTDSLWRGGKGFSDWMPATAPALGALAQYEFVGPNSPNSDKSPWNKDLNNFGPHVGFAWQFPWFGKGKTTLRGGYSISYSPINNFDGYANIIAKVPGANYQYNFTGGGTAPAYVNLSNVGSLVPLVPSASIQPLSARLDTNRQTGISVYDSNIRNPYVQTLTLSMTRNVGNNLTVDVRYNASLSRKSINGIDINAPNQYNNGLFDAFQIVRNGGESELINALIHDVPAGAGLDGSGSGSNRLRTNSITQNSLMTGNYSALASTLATTNGNMKGIDSSIAGALLRSGCLPSQMVGGACGSAHTPENFIYTNPQFTSATIQSNLGHSNYHSMQAKVTMKPTRGLTFETSYTWSRNLEDRGWSDARPGAARDYYLSDQHRSHQLTSFGTFEMPFGANGFIFRNAAGAFKKAVEGWQISWIASLTSGVPGSIIGASRLWGASNVDLVRPDLWDNKAGKVTWANKANEGWFFGNNKYMNVVDPQCATISSALTAACTAQGIWGTGLRALAYDANGNGKYESDADPIVFKNAQPGVRGNYGMNTLTGPGRWTLDMSMSKALEFMEGKRISFTIDAQNIFNHATPSNSSTQWNPRFTSIGNPQFAMNSSTPNDFGILGTKGGHRTFQAKIRISF